MTFLNTNEALKILRAEARSRGLVFKEANQLYNGKKLYCFFGTTGRVSGTNYLTTWRDIIMNGGLNSQIHD